MSEQIQLQKKNSNIFCYCNFVAKSGKVIVECQTVKYNVESEENIDLEYKELSLEQFVKFVKKWVVC